jgi:hypothetical protein
MLAHGQQTHFLAALVTSYPGYLREISNKKMMNTR